MSASKEREIDSDSDHASSFDEADDQDWADWVGDEEQKQIDGHNFASASGSSGSGLRFPTKALFLADGEQQLRTFPDTTEALSHAASLGFDLVEVIQRLSECMLKPASVDID